MKNERVELAIPESAPSGLSDLQLLSQGPAPVPDAPRWGDGDLDLSVAPELGDADVVEDADTITGLEYPTHGGSIAPVAAHRDPPHRTAHSPVVSLFGLAALAAGTALFVMRSQVPYASSALTHLDMAQAAQLAGEGQSREVWLPEIDIVG
jgi:hypothetical protein